jgi:Cdc6-like AAA superfamily ATPase
MDAAAPASMISLLPRIDGTTAMWHKVSAEERGAFPHEDVSLIDRRAECGALDQLLAAVRSGESRVLVVHGDPGVGKSALLEYVASQASGCRLARRGC